MALDPIVSLSVALAEAPGSYTFLLGSGVSRDAGVPTGTEVFWLAAGDLYRVEESEDTTPDRDALEAWLAERGHSSLGYSELLELLAPDAATRRDYLAKHFAGAEPGPAHERLAELAARGLIRVFVTTNFDRLLERALQRRGIEPIVVTSDADLAVSSGREHAECYILKPHGDYLQQTIRNTPHELAHLQPAMTVELEEAFARYGVVAIGYSGNDEAIARALLVRRSRYGVYWLARGELAEPSRTLVEKLSGRVVLRPGAAEFLDDLRRRITVFIEHPTGDTPISVTDTAIALLGRSDGVGLRELLRKERREYEHAVLAMVEGRHGENPVDDVAVDVHDTLLPVLERRLASLLPLALHDRAILADEFRSLASFRSRQPVRSGYEFWATLSDWGAWWLATIVGSYLVDQELVDGLPAIFEPRATDATRMRPRPLAASVVGEAGHRIGESVMRTMSSTNYIAPVWESLHEDITRVELIQNRYQELLAGDKQPRRALVEFDFVNNIALGIAGDRALAYWMLSTSLAEPFAARLHADPRFRERLAQGLGLRLDEFDDQAPQALDAALPLGSFPDRDAINILRTGRP